MRTRTLLAAAVLTAGIATSMAQTNFHSKVVGYINKAYPFGYSMVGTPLKGTNDLVATVLATAPVGTIVYKFTAGAYEAGNSYFGFGFWGNGAQTLPVGQGYLIRSPSGWTNTFVGEVVQDNPNTLINGYNMIGSAWPAAGTIDLYLQLTNATPGDIVYVFNDGVGYAPGNTYFGGGFWGGGNPNLSIAQGVLYRSIGPKDWTQHFTP
jgi:hypothetical protein